MLLAENIFIICWPLGWSKKQDPVFIMQKTGWTIHSSFLVWIWKRISFWDMITRGQWTTIFLCIGPFSVWWQPNEGTTKQPGDSSASLLLTSEKAVFCKKHFGVGRRHYQYHCIISSSISSASSSYCEDDPELDFWVCIWRSGQKLWANLSQKRIWKPPMALQVYINTIIM